MSQSTKRHQTGVSIGASVGPIDGNLARSPLLDPYKNISTTADRDYAPGRYRKQYEQASTNGAWGHEWGTCGKRSLLRTEGGVTTLLPALCGCFSCQLCGVRRAAWLKEQIGQAVPRYQLRWFWTLTIWTETCTPPESFALATAAWNWTRKDLARAHGRFSYLWTVEATKRGYAHLHLLASLSVSRVELSERWRTSTRGSFVVDVQSVRSERAANYLAKYCIQQATLRREPTLDELRGKRLFSKSRDVQFEPFRSPGDGSWAMIERPYWSMAAELRQRAPVLSERVQGVPCLQVRS